MRVSIKRLTFAALLCCGMFLLYSNARAQCPDSTGPSPSPDSIPWIQDSIYQQVPGTDCYIWIYYCERDLNTVPQDSVQGWFDGITIDSSSLCDSLADSTLINVARDMLDTIVASDFSNHLEPCIKNQYVIEQVFIPQCWSPSSFHSPVAGSGVTISPCSPFNFYCRKECEVCWDFNTHLPVYRNCHIVGPPVDFLCSLGVPWTPDVHGCYSADCFSQPLFKISLPGAGTEPSIDEDLQAYPNPASSSLTVSSTISGEDVQVLDVLGRNVMNGIIPTNGSLKLDISNLADGTYYVSAGHKEVRFIKKQQ